MAEGANRCDVLIGGGSFAGLALAIALKQALGPTYRVTVADRALAQAVDDARASAVVGAARRVFETIRIWDIVAGEAQPVVDMHITDSRVGDAVRPVFLSFDGEVEPGEPFAHMVENTPLLAALVERAKLDGVELVAQGVTGQTNAGSHILVTLADERTIAARLLVAADGARSSIRQRAGIATHGWDYGQSGIVTTVAHERDHGGGAGGHFFPCGPFAILPLKGKGLSILWTRPPAQAELIYARPAPEFHAQLQRGLPRHLLEITP